VSESATEEGNMGLIWERRLALWLPRPLFFGAFLVATCLSVAYLIFQWYFALPFDYGAILLTLYIAFVLMSVRWELLAESLDRQRCGLEEMISDRHEAEIRALHLTHDEIRRSRFQGAMGVLMIAGVVEVIYITSSPGSDLMGPWIQLHSGSITNILALLLGWFIGRRSVYSPWPLPQQADVDLLDLEVLYTIGRSGLRGALYIFVFLSLGSLFYLDPSLGLGLWGALSVFALGIVLALWSLLRPARRVRRLIRAVKREELSQLTPRIRQARDDVLTSDASTQGRLTDLVTYKTQVESTQEWPFDSSTLYRFGLYLLIPVASMVGGALVERVVDVVLD
jgi:hypothetical protein